MNNIESNKLLEEFLKSKSQGSPTDEFKKIINEIIKKTCKRYFLLKNKQEICIWYVKKTLFKEKWIWYNPTKNSNLIPYYIEIIKRKLAGMYNNIYEIEKDYYYHETVKKRKPKLDKIWQNQQTNVN